MMFYWELVEERDKGLSKKQDKAKGCDQSKIKWLEILTLGFVKPKRGIKKPGW